jgi:hypothetical protein
VRGFAVLYVTTPPSGRAGSALGVGASAVNAPTFRGTAPPYFVAALSGTTINLYARLATSTRFAADCSIAGVTAW